MKAWNSVQIRVGLLIGNSQLSSGRQMLIESQSDLNLAFIENSGERALQRLHDFNLDVLIVDQRTSDIDGLTFLKRLYEWFLAGVSNLPNTIFQSPYYSREIEVKAIELGALGWITSENSSEQILAQVRKFSQPEVELEVSVLMKLFSEVKVESSAQLDLVHALESRDLKTLKVLKLYSMGLTVREIAKQTTASQVSVNNIIQAFCDENGFMNRAQMLLSLHRAGYGIHG